MGYDGEARLRKDVSGKYREHMVRKISEDGVFHNPIWDWLYRCLGGHPSPWGPLRVLPPTPHSPPATSQSSKRRTLKAVQKQKQTGGCASMEICRVQGGSCKEVQYKRRLSSTDRTASYTIAVVPRLTGRLTDTIDAGGLDSHFHDAAIHLASQPNTALKHGP